MKFPQAIFSSTDKKNKIRLSKVKFSKNDVHTFGRVGVGSVYKNTTLRHHADEVQDKVKDEIGMKCGDNKSISDICNVSGVTELTAEKEQEPPKNAVESKPSKSDKLENRGLDSLIVVHRPDADIYDNSKGPTDLKDLQLAVNTAKRIRTTHKETSTLICEGKRAKINAQLEKYSSLNVLVWCSTGSSMNSNELNKEEMQRLLETNGTIPKVVVLYMTVGAKIVGDFFQRHGVEHVVSVDFDAFSGSNTLKDLVSNVILPSIEDLIVDNDLTVQSKMQKTFHKKYGWEKETMSHTTIHEGAVTNFKFNQCSAQDGIQLDMSSSCTTDWLRMNKALRKLKLSLADHQEVMNLVDKVKEHEGDGFFSFPESVSKNSSDRFRAIAFQTCKYLANKSGDSGGSFDNDVHFASTLEHAKEIKKKLEEETDIFGRTFIWFHVHEDSDLDSDTVKSVKKWNEGIEAVCIVTYSPQHCSIKEGLDLEIVPLPEQGEEGLHIGYTIHHGMITMLPEDKTEDFFENLSHETFDEIKKDLSSLTKIPKEGIKLYIDNDKSLKALLSIQDLSQLKSMVVSLSSQQTGENNTLKTRKGQSTVFQNAKIHFNIPELFELYGQVVLQLDKLTKNQEDLVATCKDEKRIHIKGDGGTGKTFVALHGVLKSLLEGDDSSKNILFVARNMALALYFGRWLWIRCQSNKDSIREIINNMVYLAGDEGSYYKFSFEGDQIKEKKITTLPGKFDEVIIDEAHGIFLTDHDYNENPTPSPTLLERLSPLPSKNPLLEKVHHILNDKCDEETKLLILSDISQASAVQEDLKFPDAECYELKQICRSTERLAGAAATYNIGDVDGTSCAHKAPGPPLKTVIFNGGHASFMEQIDDLNEYFYNKELTSKFDFDKRIYDDERLSEKKPSEIKALFNHLNEEERKDVISKLKDKSTQERLQCLLNNALPSTLFHSYADKIIEAINDLTSTFKIENKHLHDRLGIIVRDEDFRGKLESALKAKMAAKGLKLVSAAEASRMLPRDTKSTNSNDSEESCIILDIADNFNGLERLMVFGVGLDEEISDVQGSGNNMARSQIYRAITRAHLVFTAINHFVPDGWFEWICHSMLVKDDDESTESSACTSSYFDAAKNVIDSKEANFAIGDADDDYDRNDDENDPRNVKKRNKKRYGAFFEAIPSLVWDISKNDKDLPILQRSGGSLQFSPFVSDYWCVMSLEVVNCGHVSEYGKVNKDWYPNAVKKEMQSIMSKDDGQIITYVKITTGLVVYIGLRKVGEDEDATNKKNQILDCLVDSVKSLSHTFDSVDTCLYGGVDCDKTATFDSALGLYYEADRRFMRHFPNYYAEDEVVSSLAAQGKYIDVRVDGTRKGQ